MSKKIFKKTQQALANMARQAKPLGAMSSNYPSNPPDVTKILARG